MTTQLHGKNILIITANTGIERDELLKPLEALRSLGATLTHGSIKGGSTQTFLHDTEKDRQVESDGKLSGLNARDFDALIIPGGTVNADTLRQDPEAQRLVNEFVDAGKTVAAICHGPWLLISEVKECTANGWKLITSRTPDDLPAFNQAIANALQSA